MAAAAAVGLAGTWGFVPAPGGIILAGVVAAVYVCWSGGHARPETRPQEAFACARGAPIAEAPVSICVVARTLREDCEIRASQRPRN